MVPLYFAGAGLIRGFAIVTIAGLVLGVFLTRPVYAKIVEIMYN
jgi:preprotein translocase subunit SecD